MKALASEFPYGIAAQESGLSSKPESSCAAISKHTAIDLYLNILNVVPLPNFWKSFFLSIPNCKYHQPLNTNASWLLHTLVNYQ